ncbi:MAG: DUF3817 domain-containing protein [Ferruginibacter sp.]
MTNSDLKKLLHRFRMVGIAEGISFLILVLIAMPLKYLFHFPKAVQMFGWVHGILFVSFIYFALDVFGAFKKPFKWLVKAFFASILPFGTFVLDSELKKEENSL